MILRSPLFRLGLGAVFLAVLSVLFLSSSPHSPEEAPAVQGSRELDEAAEEVRAVATGMRRLEARISDQEEDTRTLQETLNRLERRLEQLDWNQLEAEAETSASTPSSAASSVSSPPAEDFDLSSLRHEDMTEDPSALAIAQPSFEWIEPIRSPNPLPLGSGQVVSALSTAEAARGDLRFVIPPAVLEGVSLTALVGRVPRGGSVQDPWPFVVVSRADNFTANGMRLPQLRGILWRGVVHGDATLSCVSASIRSLVYVFDDGVFHVANSGEQQGFGYLADKAGNPCLVGEMHSSAPEDLLRNLTAGVIAGAGGAFAEDQITRQTYEGGETASIRDGAAFRYLLGETASATASAYADYVARHANDTWDAVLAEAGREVDIHITQAIPIHYAPKQNLHDSSTFAVALPDGGLD